MDNKDDVLEIDLVHILELIVSRIWSVVITGIAGAVALFLVSSFLITPKYQSSAMFYVNNNNLSIGGASFSISSSDISASQSLVDTYIVILKTRNTLETVIETSDLDYTYEELNSMISASSVNNTEVFKVTVTSDDPVEACLIANSVATVLPDKISEIVTGSGAKVVDYAVVNGGKVSPSVTKYTAIGLLAGVVLACAVIVLEDFFDDTIRDDDFLLSTYKEIPTLAVIPSLKNDRGSYYKNNVNSYYYYKKPEDKNGKD